MVRTFRILDGIETAMRDGCVLRGDVWLPDGEGPWPVLLQRTPYRREDVHGAQYISALEFQQAIRRGFAVMVQDTRGRYGSDGLFNPFVHEAEDGADTVAWLRAQDFCDGRVAMFGASYVGATQVLAAAMDPEGLIAISPDLTTGRHGETWTWRGGATELGFLLLWIIEALAPEDLARRKVTLLPQQAARLAACLADLMQDPQESLARLPILTDERLALAPYLARWFDSDAAAAAERNREHLDALAAARPAMLVTGGWNDLFVEGSLELWETARSRLTGSDRLILGPWSHGNPKDWQGEFWHGYAASTAALSEAQLDFFAAAFEGRPPKEPVVRYFRTGSNTWHGAPDWPLPGADVRILNLSGATLSVAPAETGQSRWFVSDPSSPVPTTGGATFLPGLLLGRNSGALDQSEVEARADVLVWTSAPLSEPLEVTGLVRAVLMVDSSAPSCDWTARLCEVRKSGRSFGIVDGIRRWRNPGRPEEVEVRLGHISHLFASGSRLRLQVASSNFPRFDRNPQTGVDPACATLAEFASATQTVLGGELILPIIPVPFPVLSGLSEIGGATT